MSTTTYYRARYVSLYRVTHTPARAASKTPTPSPPAPCKSAAAPTPPLLGDLSGAEYPTTSAEVARLVSTGSFIQEAPQ